MYIFAQIKYNSCSATSKRNDYQVIIGEHGDAVMEH